MDHKERGCEAANWNEMAEDRVQQSASVIIVTNRVP